MAPRNEEPRPSLFTRVSQASKRSFRSYSSSIEADDERSSTAEGSRSDDVDTMTPSIENGSAEEGPVPSSSYIGEDTRPTSAKELAGWYMYAFASEVYVICGKSEHF
jgi:UMF1 family MFS transporter